MIESAIITELKNDIALCSFISEYAGEPSIFSRRAPQGTPFPYVVIYEQRQGDDIDVMQNFQLYVDVFDDPNTTGVAQNNTNERIEFILDRKILDHDRYGIIRIFFKDQSWVIETDPRQLHFSNVFDVRASRKKWVADTI